jgi:dUTP pyrophosphatase
MQIKVQKLNSEARLPQFASAGAACFDLHACDDAMEARNLIGMLQPGGTVIIGTGLAFEIPPGYAMLVYSRSGHGFKNNVRLANSVGIIDSDYRGEVKVKLKSDNGEPLLVKHGDRIAQAMIIPIPQIELIEAQKLTGTDRGANGFGSTGT